MSKRGSNCNIRYLWMWVEMWYMGHCSMLLEGNEVLITSSSFLIFSLFSLSHPLSLILFLFLLFTFSFRTGTEQQVKRCGCLRDLIEFQLTVEYSVLSRVERHRSNGPMDTWHTSFLAWSAFHCLHSCPALGQIDLSKVKSLAMRALEIIALIIIKGKRCIPAVSTSGWVKWPGRKHRSEGLLRRQRMNFTSGHLTGDRLSWSETRSAIERWVIQVKEKKGKRRREKRRGKRERRPLTHPLATGYSWLPFSLLFIILPFFFFLLPARGIFANAPSTFLAHIPLMRALALVAFFLLNLKPDSLFSSIGLQF